jgi:hypothetical protein
MSPSLKCVVTAVSVSPSHAPVVNPPCECGAIFDGCGRPSIQITVSSRSPHPAIFQASSLWVIGSGTIVNCSGNGPTIAYIGGYIWHWRSVAERAAMS